MEIEQIRQALTDELGEGEFSADETVWEGGYYLVYLRPAMMGCVTVTLTVHGKENLAAIGRALQSAAGETMIPLREAIDAVNEASQKCPESQWGMMYRSDAIAALQALGGGGLDVLLQEMR
jgi:hypothetical protein